MPAAIVLDATDTPTAYAGSGNDFQIDVITVPAAAYNGLGAVVAGDLIGLQVARTGNHADDTYEASFLLESIRFTFA